jgi:tRNA 2-thiouridine synthesizing protein C
MRAAPHSGIYVQEFLDQVLITAAFDQKTALLFLDDGVFQIKNAQHPALLQHKDTVAIFKALELYEVREVYAESESLHERGLSAGDLLLPATSVQRGEIAALLQSYDVVIGA